MYKVILAILFVVILSCSTQKLITTIDNGESINVLLSLAPIILTQYQTTNCGLKVFRIDNSNLRDSLTKLGVSSISIKYSHDTIDPNEYCYGNSTPLPDSCIIFGQGDFNSENKKSKSNLVFYFFGKSKPTNFRFVTFKPLAEKNKKINDSIWVYQAVHELIGI